MIFKQVMKSFNLMKMKTNEQKTSIRYKAILVLSVFMWVFSYAAIADAAADRAYILSKLKFYYVANPNTSATATLLSLSSSASDARDVFGGNAMMDSMKVFLKGILNDRAHGGDEIMQFAVKEILNIRGKDIAMFMYNDAVQFNTFAANTFVNCLEGGYVWPCASSSATVSSTGGYYGKIHLGRYFLSAVSRADVRWVFLHELTHTQDMSDFPWHTFYVNSNPYKYGADNTHFFHEAIPSMTMAFKEGIANAFAYQFQRPTSSTAPDLGSWYTPTRDVIVETVVPTAAPTPGASPDIWLYAQLQAAHITPYKTSGNYAYYHLSQLTPRFRVHNEMIIANIISAYMFNISFQRVARAFKTYNIGPNSVFSGNGNLQTLMTVLCQAGLPESMQAQSFPSCANFPDRKEYLLPLAYADYFTSFSSTSLSDFNQLFDNGLNSELIQCYWNNRTAVRAAATAASVHNFTQASTEIAIALGINSSVMEH
jgi:hypothetical protein